MVDALQRHRVCAVEKGEDLRWPESCHLPCAHCQILFQVLRGTGSASPPRSPARVGSWDPSHFREEPIATLRIKWAQAGAGLCIKVNISFCSLRNVHASPMLFLFLRKALTCTYTTNAWLHYLLGVWSVWRERVPVSPQDVLDSFQ